MKQHVRTIFFALGLLLPLSLYSQTVDINYARPGADIAPTMYGIFFEDINFGADGGLYAELVNNRSFEYPGNRLQGWKTMGGVELRDDGPFDRNPHYLRLGSPGHPARRTAIENGGWFGIGLKAGERYRFSVWARVPQGGSGKLRVECVDPKNHTDNQTLTQSWLDVVSSDWKLYELELTAPVTVERACLRIFLETLDIPVDVEHVSLFPVDTWKGRRNGLRKDLAQALYDLHPGIFRFPGGCIVEGADLDSRYSWKNSVGPVENRPLNENRWQYCFEGRLFPDYHQSYGLGFYELFCLSEGIGAEPLPILSAGLACQFMNDISGHAPLDRLQPFIQDAIDLVEFANGGTDTPWGALRAQMGHPEPFNMKYIGIGNEQWGPEFPERLEPILKAFRAACPGIEVVGSAGPFAEGEGFDYLWSEMRRLDADLVDEHYYKPEKWFLENATRYDAYPRKGSKVFAGEYACHGDGRKYNHFYAALCEAAFMTGLERNADVVRMATYAPLFAHVEGWQWRPDLIWYDNLNSWRSCSWHVQALYSEFRGEHVLATSMDSRPVAGQDGLYASSVKDGNRVYVKLVNTTDRAREINLDFLGLKKKQSLRAVRKVSFTTEKLLEDNIGSPAPVVPVQAPVQGKELSRKDSRYPLQLPPYSFEIYVFENN